MASGLSTTTRFGAIVLAIGIFGGVLVTRGEQLLRQAIQQVAPEQLSNVGAMATRVAAGDVPAALAIVEPSLRETVAPLALQAFVGAFQTMLLCAGGAALVFSVLVGLLLSRPLPALMLQSAR
jgi:hypothetical protein